MTDSARVPVSPDATITPPPCVLPSYVPQCQSSWTDWAVHQYSSPPYDESGPSGCSQYLYVKSVPQNCSAAVAAFSSSDNSWISAAIASPPSCAQASVTGSVCSGLISSWLGQQAAYNPGVGGVQGGDFNYTTLSDGSLGRVYTWPASTTFAPGCTLGCQSCAIQGGTVQLIYWPPATSTYGPDGMYTALTGNATGPIIAETLGTTFTSPTVYVSFDSLWARDSCTPFGKTHAGSIVAITDTADLQSLWGYGRYNQLGFTVSPSHETQLT